MIDRHIKPTLNHLLDANPAVVLIGPRQVGKTTLAREVARERNAIYLDLERPSDLAKIADVESYCEETADSLLVLDEIHRAPGLFAPLRSIIDERRQAGKRTGQFLLLGSASIDLLKQSSETLAGRVAYCELHALNTREVPAEELGRLWCRGGLPARSSGHRRQLGRLRHREYHQRAAEASLLRLLPDGVGGAENIISALRALTAGGAEVDRRRRGRDLGGRGQA